MMRLVILENDPNDVINKGEGVQIIVVTKGTHQIRVTSSVSTKFYFLAQWEERV